MRGTCFYVDFSLVQYRKNNLTKVFETYRVVANQKNSCVSQVERIPAHGSRLKTACRHMGVA
jgi:hypothetical protein